MLTLKKGDAVKLLSPESNLIPLLKHEGWTVDGEEERPADAPRRGRPPKAKEEVEQETDEASE